MEGGVSGVSESFPGSLDARAPTHHHIDNEEKVANPPREMPMTLQIILLITPLRNDTQRVLQEGHHDEETTKGRQVRLDRLGVDIDVVFDLGGNGTDLVEGSLLGWVGRGGTSLACVGGLAVGHCGGW